MTKKKCKHLGPGPALGQSTKMPKSAMISLQFAAETDDPIMATRPLIHTDDSPVTDALRKPDKIMMILP